MRKVLRAASRMSVISGLLLASWLVVPDTPLADEPDCRERWAVGGTQGQSEPWLRTGGYRIGMTKSEAHQIRRVGLQNSIARDKWVFLFSVGRAVLEFEDGKLGSATLILEGQDFQTIYKDLADVLGLPADGGESYALWRNEDCDTVKLVSRDDSFVNVTIQSIDYFETKTLRRK